MSEAAPPGVTGPVGTPEQPVPGVTGPVGDFTETPATGAWAALTSALGHDLQRGMHRAEQARRRLSRLKV